MIKNLLGMKFGRLLVISKEPSSKDGRAMWLCECECGNTVITKGKYLLNGDTKSCGCLNLERIREQGLSNTKPNTIKIIDDLIYVYFNNSDDYFICDKEDLEKVKQATWHKNKSGYARGIIGTKMILFHDYLLLETLNGLFVDHIDGNRLNNRRNNLRVVTKTQNNRNRKINSNNVTGYTGIRKTYNNKWTAIITHDYKTYHLGTFKTFEEAVHARKQAEIKYFGEYRRYAS